MTTEELIAARRAEPWREALRKSKKNKERTDIPRVEMNELDAEYRSHTRLEEVNLGLTKEQAMQEAQRCLDCPNPTCMQGCPVSINIPTFVKNIERGEFLEAARVLKETSALPAVCGRVCPQEKQCESKCIHLKMGKPAVAIGYLERFAADYERESGNISIPEVAEKNGIKIAVVGSGPAGLSFAGDMAKRGYDVTVFEALHEIGGVLKYGIPEFRLPNKIVDVEIEGLRKMGVKFMTNCIVGKTISYDDLHADGFKGIFAASGAGLPNFMNIPGESLKGVYSANEFLTRINLMKAYKEGSKTPIQHAKKVAVVGGGNVAMDAARSAKRLGAEEVYIVYRRGMEELPARKEEVEHAEEEGIIFKTLHNPVEILGDEDGLVSGMKCVEMELGEPDESGRRRPIVKEGSEFVLDVDSVIMSIGTSPNPLIRSTTPGLDANNRGCLITKDEKGETTREGVYAGGDAVTGAATVILAMGAGKEAAKAIDEYIKSK